MIPTVMGIDQEAAVRYSLTFSDVAILSWINKVFQSEGAHRMDVDGIAYVWVNYATLLADYPLLGLGSKRGLAYRLSDLTRKGLICHYTYKVLGKFSYYAITDEGRKLFSDHRKNISDGMKEISDTHRKNISEQRPNTIINRNNKEEEIYKEEDAAPAGAEAPTSSTVKKASVREAASATSSSEYLAAAERIYLAYPTHTDVRRRVAKSKSDKERIARDLRNGKYTEKKITAVILRYIEDSEGYVMDLKTFLNNIPDYDDLEAAALAPAKKSKYSNAQQA